MISSVIATFTTNSSELEITIQEISNHPNLEIGKLVDNRVLPITIETSNKHDMEHITRWLQSRRGVALVDVVFVHLEDEKQTSAMIADHQLEN